MMANISEYSVVIYERKPGHWRAAISPKVLDSIVTPVDSASESEARLAAGRLISKL
jgi:hypothetical protein